jgi:hypothetical protein
MCMTVYVASDCELPMPAKNDAEPGFHVAIADAEDFHADNPIRRHPFLYSAHPDNGCGCTFGGVGQTFDDNKGEWVRYLYPKAEAARRGLADFLMAAVQRQKTVEMFISCSGDECYPLDEHLRLKARPTDFLRADAVLFSNRAIIVVSDEDA